MLQSSSSIASPFLLTPLPPPIPPPRETASKNKTRDELAPRWRSTDLPRPGLPGDRQNVVPPPVVAPQPLQRLTEVPTVVRPSALTSPVVNSDQRSTADSNASVRDSCLHPSWLTWRRWRQWFQCRIEDIEDAPSWLVSLVTHLCLILILALITAAARSAGPVLKFSFERGDAGDERSLAVFEISELEAPDPQLSSDQSVEELSPASIQPIAVQNPNVSLAMVSVASAVSKSSKPSGASLPKEGDGLATEESASASGMFAGRSGPLKAELLRRGGGDQTTEQAVALGLAWLKRQQQADGSWSMRGPYSDGSLSQNSVAATSMAMLAFMGAGNTHRTGEYKKELWDAVRWLAKKQDAKGFMAHDGGEHERMYAQAQATIALCELYAMTGDSWLRPKAQLACDFAVDAQSPEGGWRYYPRMDSDTSVTGWFVMGLKSGQVGGLNIDHYVFANVRRYLETVARYDGAAYAYQPQDIASPSMTAEGLLIQQYLGMPREEPAMSQGLGALVANHLIDANDRDAYYWYYATQAIHHLGTELWDRWNSQMKRTIPPLQRKTGPEAGSWDPEDDQWGSYAGRLYVTCLSIYCLEVYYRHLPLYETTNIVEP